MTWSVEFALSFSEIRSFTRVDMMGGVLINGVGLAFCRMAVGAHGGRIDVESEVGTTFTVTLPAG